jgi:hypothetical protein
MPGKRVTKSTTLNDIIKHYRFWEKKFWESDNPTFLAKAEDILIRLRNQMLAYYKTVPVRTKFQEQQKGIIFEGLEDPVEEKRKIMEKDHSGVDEVLKKNMDPDCVSLTPEAQQFLIKNPRFTGDTEDSTTGD